MDIDDEDPRKRLEAICARAVLGMGSDKASPLKDRVLLTGDEKTSHRCLTLTSLVDGIKGNNLIGRVQKLQGGASVLQAGPLGHLSVNSADSMRKLQRGLQLYFGLFADGAQDHWNNPSPPSSLEVHATEAPPSGSQTRSCLGTYLQSRFGGQPLISVTSRTNNSRSAASRWELARRLNPTIGADPLLRRRIKLAESLLTAPLEQGLSKASIFVGCSMATAAESGSTLEYARLAGDYANHRVLRWQLLLRPHNVVPHPSQKPTSETSPSGGGVSTSCRERSAQRIVHIS